MKRFLLITLFLWTSILNAQLAPAIGQNYDTNFLKNPSFENGKTGWTNSAGIWLITKNTTDTNNLIAASRVSLSAQTLNQQGCFTAPAGINPVLQLSANLNVPLAIINARLCASVAGVKTCGEVITGRAGYQPAVVNFSSTGGAIICAIFETTGNATGQVSSSAFSIKQNINSIASFPINGPATIQTTITIGAVTTPPTKGTLVTDRIVWTRNETRIIADYQYEQSAGGAVGSGDYLFTLPTGLSFDSTIVNFYTGSTGVNFAKTIVGFGTVSNGTGVLVAYDATRFRMYTNTPTATGFYGSGLFGISGANGFGFHIDAPISGWNANTNVALSGCLDAWSCTDEFRATGTTTSGVIDANSENVEFINGNCTAANPTVCTFTRTYGIAPQCSASLISNSAVLFPTTATTTTVSITSNLSTTGAAQPSIPFLLRCSRASTDFKPKTSILTTLGFTGEILTMATAACPEGTLDADGIAISRTTYASLFNVMGITHGQGDGSTTFNKPDYRGRFLRGVTGASANDPDAASRTAMATGGNTGNNIGSVQLDEFKSHTHGANFMLDAVKVGAGAGDMGYVTRTGVSNVNSTAYTVGGNESRPKNAYVKYCVRY